MITQLLVERLFYLYFCSFIFFVGVADLLIILIIHMEKYHDLEDIAYPIKKTYKRISKGIHASMRIIISDRNWG